MINHFGIKQFVSNMVFILFTAGISFTLILCELSIKDAKSLEHLIIVLVIIIVCALLFKVAVISIGNIMRFQMWKSQGNGHSMPIPILFFVYDTKAKNMSFRLDPAFMETVFVPREIIVQVNNGDMDVEDAKREVGSIEKRIIVIEIALIGIFLMISLVTKSYLFAIIPSVAAASYVLTGLVRGDLIQGKFVQIHYIQTELWPLYFGTQAYLYCDRSGVITDEFIKTDIKYGEKERIELWLLVTWQMIFLRKCAKDEIAIPRETLDRIETYWLNFRIDRWFLTRERINFMKIFLLWTMKEGDETREKRTRNMFRYLFETEDLGEKTRQKLISWYTGLEKLTTNKPADEIIDRVTFACNFPEYEEVHFNATVSY